MRATETTIQQLTVHVAAVAAAAAAAAAAAVGCAAAAVAAATAATAGLLHLPGTGDTLAGRAVVHEAVAVAIELVHGAAVHGFPAASGVQVPFRADGVSPQPLVHELWRAHGGGGGGAGLGGGDGGNFVGKDAPPPMPPSMTGGDGDGGGGSKVASQTHAPSQSCSTQQ